jgi:hypothetical protein
MLFVDFYCVFLVLLAYKGIYHIWEIYIEKLSSGTKPDKVYKFTLLLVAGLFSALFVSLAYLIQENAPFIKIYLTHRWL